MVTELSQALTLDEQAQLQERLMLLLASRVRYATQGDSSSVSQEYAQALLEGVVFALQTHLQAQGLPPARCWNPLCKPCMRKRYPPCKDCWIRGGRFICAPAKPRRCFPIARCTIPCKPSRAF